MNNLHRELAPVSDEAWEQIEQEATRTLKRHLAARRVVDTQGPKGFELAAVGTGHQREIAAPHEGVHGALREARALVELRVPFELDRAAIDAAERGATDCDWAPVKEAARKIAFAEDRAIFDGYAAAHIQGIRQASSNTALALPADPAGYPTAVAQAVSQLRLAGVNGPYTLVLGSDTYTAMSGGSEDRYPILRHVEKLVDGEIIWAPAIEGGLVLSTRGGDFVLDLGQDFSIGYLGHSKTGVTLYLQESMTFRALTAEASVALVRKKK